MKQITMNSVDVERIQSSLKDARLSNRINVNEADALAQELRKAKLVDPHKVPSNLVTMNSIVEVRIIATDKTMRIQLVYPQDADIKKSKISILSPVGAAIIGYRQGDEVAWKVPAGETKIRIEKIVYQPEAAGDYLL